MLAVALDHRRGLIEFHAFRILQHSFWTSTVPRTSTRIPLLERQGDSLKCGGVTMKVAAAKKMRRSNVNLRICGMSEPSVEIVCPAWRSPGAL